MIDPTRYWPDVPPGAFTILREIAQARQTQAEWDATAGELPASDESLRIVASVLCEPHVERTRLLQCAALIVRCIESREGYVMTQDSNSNFYCLTPDSGEPPCAGLAALEAEIERLRGLIDAMRTAAQIDDWHTFDRCVREAGRNAASSGERDD